MRSPSPISRRRGASGIEYALAAGLVAIVVLVTLISAGGSINFLLHRVGNRLETAGNAAGQTGGQGAGQANPTGPTAGSYAVGGGTVYVARSVAASAVIAAAVTNTTGTPVITAVSGGANCSASLSSGTITLTVTASPASCGYTVQDAAGSASGTLAVTALHPTSCRALYTAEPTLTGMAAYTLRSGAGTIPGFCDMTNGGWTLVARTANTAGLGYDAANWSSGAPLNAASPDATTNANAIFDSYAAVTGTQMRGCAGASTGCIASASFGDQTAQSAFSAVTGFSVSRSAITATFPPNDPGEPNCNAGGFNVGVASYSMARFGLVANDQNDCASPDSVWGFGIKTFYSAGCGAGSVIYNGGTTVTTCAQGTLWIR